MTAKCYRHHLCCQACTSCYQNPSCVQPASQGMQADQSLKDELTGGTTPFQTWKLHLFCTSMPHTRSWRSYTAASASVSSTILGQSHGKQGPDSKALKLCRKSLMQAETLSIPSCVLMLRNHVRHAFALWEAMAFAHPSLLDSSLLAR